MNSYAKDQYKAAIHEIADLAQQAAQSAEDGLHPARLRDLANDITRWASHARNWTES